MMMVVRGLVLTEQTSRGYRETEWTRQSMKYSELWSIHQSSCLCPKTPIATHLDILFHLL